MKYQPDVAVTDPSGTGSVIIEVKVFPNGDVRMATEYMRRLLEFVALPASPFVLLVTPQTGYLWTSPGAVLHGGLPPITFPLGRIIQHYLPSSRQGPVREPVLASIVTEWLMDLTDGGGVDIDGDVESVLRTSGFLAAVRHGRVQVPAYQ